MKNLLVNKKYFGVRKRLPLSREELFACATLLKVRLPINRNPRFSTPVYSGKNQPMNGILNIDKPAGITSFDVVRKIRYLTGVKKVGHSGTLDPFATGVLLVFVGRETTKHISKFSNLDKEYYAKVKFGEKTDTADLTGKVIKRKPIPELSISQIESVCQNFIGKIQQIPPMYSAIKKDGIRLYKLARKGNTIEREPRRVEIKELELLEYNKPFLKFSSVVSKGTYIRTLAEDIAEKLGTIGHLVELRRMGIGKFSVENALNFNKLTTKIVQENIEKDLFLF
ncbi:MAG: tRNA pseudouridine(55) synthase TruB [Candidatus Cloacimonadota bacterium]|nr:tRNA pseudouridine(55) synthase TruB [Candidatus Cloacimonadota bacterium]